VRDPLFLQKVTAVAMQDLIQRLTFLDAPHGIIDGWSTIP
jgi:hypothetical protein